MGFGLFYEMEKNPVIFETTNQWWLMMLEGQWTSKKTMHMVASCGIRDWNNSAFPSNEQIPKTSKNHVRMEHDGSPYLVTNYPRIVSGLDG